MKVIKRSGEEVLFDKSKIEIAISKANEEEFDQSKKLSSNQIKDIASNIESYASTAGHILSVEDIQDLVEEKISPISFDIAKKYIVYRYDHALKRQRNTTDGELESLLNLRNKKREEENSNKNVKINSTQRDYIAGIACEDYAKRNILPPDLLKAHEDGIIHIHDMDYIAMHEHNCCLVNLKDMLQNGTVINGKTIDKPHKFSVACNIATQIMAQVASSQYGGQTISLSHLAPFVQSSRLKFRKQIKKQIEDYNLNITNEQFDKLVEDKVNEDIVNGIQTMQYQINTLMTCNGQTPFVSVTMYLGEVSDPQTKSDLNKIIIEVLKQRIVGIKNEVGVWITPAFPKLLYILEPDNITPDSKYWETTVLAAKCVTKRMVPDFISEKKMKELKDNNVYPCIKTCA